MPKDLGQRVHNLCFLMKKMCEYMSLNQTSLSSKSHVIVIWSEKEFKLMY